MKLHIIQIEYDTFDRIRGMQKPTSNPKTAFVIRLIYPKGNFESSSYINKLFTDALEVSLVAHNFASTLDATDISDIATPHITKKLPAGINHKVVGYIGRYLIQKGKLVPYC